MLPLASSWILMLDLRQRLSRSLEVSNRSRISSLYSCSPGETAVRATWVSQGESSEGWGTRECMLDRVWDCVEIAGGKYNILNTWWKLLAKVYYNT